MNSVTPAAPDPSMPAHLRPEVSQAIEEAHEYERQGNAQAAIDRLEQMLANMPGGSALDVLKERVTLALTTAELLVNAGDTPTAKRRLVEEFRLANEAFQRIKASGSEADKRMAFRGLVQMRDLHARLDVTGKAAPELGIDRWLNSDPTTLEDLRGKVVLLEFWATWCRPCEQLFPKIKELHSRHAAAGLTVLALTRFFMAYGGTEEAKAQEIQLIRDFIQKNEIQFPVGIAEDETLQSKYGATALPMLALIDRSSIVRYFAFSPDDDNFQTVLAECLNNLA